MKSRNALSIRPVPITRRSHLFPFRTQKLSSVVPKILGWRRPGKIGRRRLSLCPFSRAPATRRGPFSFARRFRRQAPFSFVRQGPFRLRGGLGGRGPFLCGRPLFVCAAGGLFLCGRGPARPAPLRREAGTLCRSTFGGAARGFLRRPGKGTPRRCGDSPAF